MLNRPQWFASALAFVIVFTVQGVAQQTASSGTFILHKFANPIGTETYSIETKNDTYILTSHFLFTDRGTKVPLESTFTARTRDLSPLSYRAKGKASRFAEIDDSVTVTGTTISIDRSGKSETQVADKSWYVADGYSPVAMQEQLVRWWLKQGKPEEFIVYPSKALVHISPSGTLTVGNIAAHGYTVSGLIWGRECLWIDDAQNLIALVSTDAEFDHFEAVREQ